MKITVSTRKETGQHFLNIPITGENMKELIRLFPFVMNDEKLMDEINQLKSLQQ